jgi:hypothetical protein
VRLLSITIVNSPTLANFHMSHEPLCVIVGSESITGVPGSRVHESDESYQDERK